MQASVGLAPDPPREQIGAAMVSKVSPRPDLGIGLIGDGLMAKEHSMAWHNLHAVYGDVPVKPRLVALVHPDQDRARVGAERYGYERGSTSWQAVVNDPAVDVIDIVTPNAAHKDVAIAAAKAGKHIWCEKPLALTAAGAAEMTQAAEAAGIRTLVGFTYLRNPALVLARSLIEANELGHLVSLKGVFRADTMIDPSVPFTWRTDRERAGGGAFADLGSHLVSIARYLVGDVRRVCGISRTVVPQRSDSAGTMRQVDNDDLTMALVEFDNDVVGTLWASRVETGRAFELSFTLTGTEGAIRFDQCNISQLEVKLASDSSTGHGFRTIEVGPGHGDYAHLWPMSGMNIGIHELKYFEVRHLVDAIHDGVAAYPDFRDGWEVQRVIEAVERSTLRQTWEAVG